MKKISLTLLLSLLFYQGFCQNFSQKRDSLMELQREQSELYMKYKDNDTQKADKYLSLSNTLFEETVIFVIDYVSTHPDEAAVIIDENLFMFDRDYNHLARVMEIIEKLPQFDAKVKERVVQKYNEVAKKRVLGKVAQNFTLTDMEGKEVSLYDYKGKYVWLNFWASWCAPCRAKSRLIVSEYNTIKNDDLVILSVSFDESEKLWLDAAKKDGICWVSLRNKEGFGGSIKDEYNIESLPTTFLLDREMKITLENPTISEVKNCILEKN